jgi:hypothetical protein
VSDYNFDTDVLRGQMADKLAENEEQFAFVITNAICNVDIDAAIELGQLGDEANSETAAAKLRKLADAIELGVIA